MESGEKDSALKKWWNLSGQGRYISQAVFLVLTIWVGYRMVSGVRGATIERYCPFGGIETLIPWLNKTGTLCSLSTTNISVFVGVAVMTLILKRVFCSHVCPMGAVLEWVGIFSRKTGIGAWKIPYAVDNTLKLVKYPLMLVIICLTVIYGELIFRTFDPYYILFTAGKGHEIASWSMWFLVGVIIVGYIIPLSFCKYMCPLGACLAPFGRLGIAKVCRDSEACTDCGSCDKACEWGIKVSELKSVTSAECSNCLECVRKCPTKGALALKIGGGGK